MNMTSLTQTIVSYWLPTRNGPYSSRWTAAAAAAKRRWRHSWQNSFGQRRLPYRRLLSSPAQRIPNWAETPCANMDLTRLREEVLVPAQAGAAVRSRAYSCREGSYLPEQCVPPAPLYILEGSYSHHPILAGFYDLKVFVTCSKEEQARRLQAREGERYENFVRRWIPLEEAYFAQCRIEALADLLWDTTNL